MKSVSSAVPFIGLLALIGIGVLQPVAAATNQSPQGMIQAYTPLLHFADGEKFYPTSVEYIISSSTLMQRNADGTSTMVDSAPTSTTLGSRNSPTMFLNNKLGDVNAIAADYAAKAAGAGYYIYAHVVSSGSSTVVQYWLFYSYNNGLLNDHQSDLEVVEVFLDGQGTPTQALYSQHLAGETVSWSDVETQGGHPVVYVALGSHANYFRPYQGKIGIENDVVNAGGPTITPDKLTVVTLLDGSNRPASQSWLNFPGRWGFTGTDTQIATGMAGPNGPVFNDNGIRWADPSGYAAKTISVGSTYFYLAWVAANLILIYAAYTVLRGSLKIVGIRRVSRSGGLRVGKFLKGRGGVGVALGLIGVAITVAALFLPWYSITASSQTGPLSGPNAVQLMSVNGINGLSVNMFTGPNADSTSGLTTFASSQVPFAIFIGFGLVLLFMDIVGVKSGRSLGRKLMIGAVTSLLPFVFIYAFVSYLPNLVPLAASLLGGQTVPPQAVQMVQTVASNPISGTATQTFPVVGATTVAWGFGLGVYLFIVAALLRIIGGAIAATVPELSPSSPPSAPPSDVAAPGTPVPGRAVGSNLRKAPL